MNMMKIISAAALLLGVAAAGGALAETYEGNPTTPCLICHETLHPGIVKQWEESKHSLVNVKCYVCHHAREDDPSGYDHNGYRITAVPSPQYCESCHPQQVAESARSKHAGGALGPHRGVGRVNPDGRPGSCTSCHLHHSFSVSEARKP
jgi:hypothetical protein